MKETKIGNCVKSSNFYTTKSMNTCIYKEMKVFNIDQHLIQIIQRKTGDVKKL